MAQTATTKMTVKAELRTPISTAEVVHYDDFGAVEMLVESHDSFRVDMCITPRPEGSRACYSNRWNENRFEPLGKIFLIPPGEKLMVCSDGSTMHTSVVCHLKPEIVRAGLEVDLEWNDRLLEAGLDIKHKYIHSLLVRLAGETTHQGFASNTFVEHLSAQLAIELARYFVRIEKVKAHSGGLSPWRLRLIDERLIEIKESPSLLDLANLCKISVRQLTRGFKVSRGCSLGEYIATCGIDHAKRMLIADEDIKVIAHTLGFSSSASFGSAFRRATGSTPRAFKQRAPTLGARS